MWEMEGHKVNTQIIPGKDQSYEEDKAGERMETNAGI